MRPLPTWPILLAAMTDAPLGFHDLESMRRQNPAWRLLCADSAPLVVSFLYRAFVAKNVRTVPEGELIAQLDDHLFHLRETEGAEAFPRIGRLYLDDWASAERGWVRKYYPAGSDEPHFDLTPATEKVIEWLAGLQQRKQFVGTESRLMLVFELLRDIARGTQQDRAARLDDLERRKAAIEAEIQSVREGRFALMEDTQIRDRFQQMAAMARALLADFREVEQNFRDLDRAVREKVATWEGSKGELLDQVFGERDAIAASDQGRSFRAFWDFLMSPARQEELSALLDEALALEAVAALKPDPRLRRVHFDWLEAGEVTQRTVARLSEQLRRFLDDRAWLENRRIMQLIRGIEQHAVAVSSQPPAGPLMDMSDFAPEIELPLDRPLFTPPWKPHIEGQVVLDDGTQVSTDALFELSHVDRELLAGRIRRALQSRDQISLGDLIGEHPLEQGLAELLTYFSLAADDARAMIDDTCTQTVDWAESGGRGRQATVPLVIWTR